MSGFAVSKGGGGFVYTNGGGHPLICFLFTVGGRIEVDSEVGNGCTFRFFIRVSAVQMGRNQIQDADAKGNENALMLDYTQKSVRRKPHVLVVEDNVINQKVLLRQLRKAGLTCESANDGLEALNRLKEVKATEGAIDKPFDVVLMDLEMPVMDGLTAITEIRKLEQAGQLHRSYVLALTGNARQAQIDDAVAHGMDQVIIKPYNITAVLEMIQDQVDAADAAI